MGVGEQIDERDGGLNLVKLVLELLRWMIKKCGDPDCYGGEFWIPVAGAMCV
jgi:hypothetical protein